MNKPYVKQFDKEGKLLNPIQDKYFSKTLIQFIELKGNQVPVYYPNRKERRALQFKKN